MRFSMLMCFLSCWVFGSCLVYGDVETCKIAQCYRKVIEGYEKDLTALINRKASNKECYERRQVRDQELVKLLESAPEDLTQLSSEDLCALAELNEHLMDWGQVVVFAQQGIDKDRGHSQCYASLVRSLLNLDRVRDAEDQVELAETHAVDNKVVAGLRKMVYIKLSRKGFWGRAYSQIGKCYQGYLELMPADAGSAARATVSIDEFLEASVRAGKEEEGRESLAAMLERAEQLLDNSKQSDADETQFGERDGITFGLYCFVYELQKRLEPGKLAGLQEEWLNCAVDRFCLDPNHRHFKEIQVVIFRIGRDVKVTPQTISVATARLKQIKGDIDGSVLADALEEWGSTVSEE